SHARGGGPETWETSLYLPPSSEPPSDFHLLLVAGFTPTREARKTILSTFLQRKGEEHPDLRCDIRCFFRHTETAVELQHHVLAQRILYFADDLRFTLITLERERHTPGGGETFDVLKRIRTEF